MFKTISCGPPCGLSENGLGTPAWITTNRRPACCWPVAGSVTTIPCTSMLLGPAPLKDGQEKLENAKFPTVMVWPESLSNGAASLGIETRLTAAAIRTAITPRRAMLRVLSIPTRKNLLLPIT